VNFVVDLNVATDWTGFLAGAGFTAVHWSDEGAPNATDRELLQWTAERGYVLLTADLDEAAAVAAAGNSRPGVILAPPGALTPETLGGAVLAAIHRAKSALAAGAIVTIVAGDAPARIRPL